jgi:hypothetical protein
MRSRITAIVFLMALGGCSVNANSQCFSSRSVVLPERALVMANVTNGQSGRAIAEAMLEGRFDDVTAMLARDRQLASTQVIYDKAFNSERPKGQYGDLMTLAVSRCDLAMIKGLLDLGLSPDGVQVGEALTLALLADSPEMAELLLQSGASPDPQKRGGTNAMQEVTAFGHASGVMMLLRHGADVNWEDQFGDGHLQNAVDMDKFVIAELLVAKGANPWRIGGAGNMAVQGIAKPLAINDPHEDAARLRLQTQAQNFAKTLGLPWPPPEVKHVRSLVLQGNWPTGPMIAAGIPPVSVIALADMRRRFGGGEDSRTQ